MQQEIANKTLPTRYWQQKLNFWSDGPYTDAAKQQNKRNCQGKGSKRRKKPTTVIFAFAHT